MNDTLKSNHREVPDRSEEDIINSYGLDGLDLLPRPSRRPN